MTDAAKHLPKTAMPSPQDVCALIVTHHPDNEFPRRAAHIARQAGCVMIIDNGSGHAAADVLASTAETGNVHVLRNEQNLGIAAALNQGVSWAKQQGFELAILLDQDTTAHDDMVLGLLGAYAEYPDRGRLAVLGCNFCDVCGVSHYTLSESANASWSERPLVISSGSLISIDAWSQLGGFRDEYFIDDVDNEYCVRAWCRGFTTAVATRPLMRHGIGSATRRQLAWRVASVTNHAPVRRYYMTRNRIVLVKTYFVRRPAWMLRLLYSYLKNVFLMFLFERRREEKLRFVLLGAWHGIVGRMGRR